MKELLNKFDKECCEFLDSGIHIDYEKTRAFLSESVKSALESVRLEETIKPVTLLDKSVELYNEGFQNGFNSAKADLDEKIDNYFKE